MRIPLAFAAALLRAAGAFAQESSLAAYRLNFAMHEMENSKRLNTRSYSMLVEPGAKGVLKIGAKVPVPTNPDPTSLRFSTLAASVWLTELMTVSVPWLTPSMTRSPALST